MGQSPRTDAEVVSAPAVTSDIGDYVLRGEIPSEKGKRGTQ